MPRCPTVDTLPAPPPGKTGWPWTEESQQLPDTVQNGSPWPKVSIVTPSYNQDRFLEESIRSVLLQGYPDLEYIIIDGGSTDGSVEIIKKYERWITYWVSEPDRGQSHAINKGLEKSTGEFFNWHNADDLLTVNSLATTAVALIQHPNAGYVHGYRIVIDSHSQIQYDTRHPTWENMARVPELSDSIALLRGGIQIGGLMRRQLVVKLGGVDENLHYVMDRDLVLRLELIQPPVYVDFPVVCWRAHPEAKTLLWNADRAKERLKIAHKIFSQEALPSAVKPLKWKTFATAHRFAWECYAQTGMKAHALWHACLDIVSLPFDGWNERQLLIKRLTQTKRGLWSKILILVMKKIGRLTAPLRSL